MIGQMAIPGRRLGGLLVSERRWRRNAESSAIRWSIAARLRSIIVVTQAQGVAESDAKRTVNPREAGQLAEAGR